MIVNFNNLTKILYNTTAINKIMFNNVEVWSKETRPYPDWVYELGTPIYALKAVDGAYYESNVTAARETAFNSKFRWKMEYNAIPVRGYEISGVGGSSTNTTYYVGRTNALSRNMVYGNFGSNIKISTEYLQENIIYDIVVDYKNKQVLLNNNIVSSIEFDADAPTFNGNATKVPIGTYKPSATSIPSGNTYDNTLYLVQQWIDDELVVNEIPFKSNDGTLGMLDIVSRELLTNAGSGEFIAVEREYPDWVYEMGQPLIGLKTDGLQYINTGKIYTNDVHSFETKFMFIGADVTKGVIGARNTGLSSATWNNVFRNVTNANNIRVDSLGSTATTTISDIYDNTLYSVKSDSEGFWVDGELKLPRIGTGATNVEFFIGSFNNNNGEPYPAAKQVIYPITIKEMATGNVAAQYVPFKANDGTLGMLDLVSRELLTNAGTGEFEEVSLESTTAQLMSLGVTPSSSVEENIVMLNNMGVSV